MHESAHFECTKTYTWGLISSANPSRPQKKNRTTPHQASVDCATSPVQSHTNISTSASNTCGTTPRSTCDGRRARYALVQAFCLCHCAHLHLKESVSIRVLGWSRLDFELQSRRPANVGLVHRVSAARHGRSEFTPTRSGRRQGRQWIGAHLADCGI